MKGYLWTGSRPGGDVFFDWHASRAAACLDTVVPVDFQGTVQCDGYEAYNRLARRSGKEIKLAYCWAHVRRKYNDALEGSPRPAGWMIKQIQLLYRIESRLREQKAGPALRQAVRASQSQPIVARIKKACESLVRSKRFLPKSAILYTVIESCRRRGIDPYAYLRDVLTRLPRMTMHQVPEILPAVWGKPEPLRKAS